MEEFGKLLRKLRRQKDGLDQDNKQRKQTVVELAKNIGYSRPFIYKVEGGDQMFPMEALPLLATELGVDMSLLFWSWVRTSIRHYCGSDVAEIEAGRRIPGKDDDGNPKSKDVTKNRRLLEMSHGQRQKYISHFESELGLTIPLSEPEDTSEHQITADFVQEMERQGKASIKYVRDLFRQQSLLEGNVDSEQEIDLITRMRLMEPDVRTTLLDQAYSLLAIPPFPNDDDLLNFEDKWVQAWAKLYVVDLKDYLTLGSSWIEHLGALIRKNVKLSYLLSPDSLNNQTETENDAKALSNLVAKAAGMTVSEIHNQLEFRIFNTSSPNQLRTNFGVYSTRGIGQYGTNIKIGYWFFYPLMKGEAMSDDRHNSRMTRSQTEEAETVFTNAWANNATSLTCL